MFYEIRTYRLRTGSLPAYIKDVTEEGIAIQKKHLGTLIGYYFSEIGQLNQIVHIWAFTSLDDREKRRDTLARDPQWAAFIPRLQAHIETMDNKIMKGMPFLESEVKS
ncbi:MULTISPECIES: NIPSNAP family protein [Acetobacter]|uniref:NIPSNAP family protein n=1 Tax=Acetobacter thailandicus TaxID=1502842 RepID=A0ABT3QC28_9PROT|nr:MULTISPECIES: NIPSNAP family protein [Acetobacter]MBS0959001.1 NIPSNAP family protein [Acetobacter thailandicus]MBS0980355.1 NIPSNAP family protein [Acetobacter thailandicus]MBS0985112.1 NIPSNAP family protein [Acetobacter thailandicus]MBS1003349.1 NIPSNAP family protein [Acetobacter thailandicus]MCX2562816.1 NIPSNAP family protein [Acetobacter thailandicus]